MAFLETIIHSITKKELATDCCRKTRGVEETTSLIQDILETFSGDQGCDTPRCATVGPRMDLGNLGLPKEACSMYSRPQLLKGKLKF